MNESADIIILALIAGFVFYKLYNLLGQTGDSDKVTTKSSKRNIVDIFPIEDVSANTDTDIEKVVADKLTLTEDVRKVFDEIYLVDKTFDEKKFLQGATKAFEMILKAYCEADQENLKKLLSKDVFKQFWEDLEQRKNNKEILDKTLISIVSSEIVKANLKKKIATIAVRFVSQQVNLIKDNKGNIIEGDSSEIDTVKDIWEFSRNISSHDPVWKLVETSSVE